MPGEDWSAEAARIEAEFRYHDDHPPDLHDPRFQQPNPNQRPFPDNRGGSSSNNGGGKGGSRSQNQYVPRHSYSSSRSYDRREQGNKSSWVVGGVIAGIVVAAFAGLHIWSRKAYAEQRGVEQREKERAFDRAKRNRRRDEERREREADREDEEQERRDRPRIGYQESSVRSSRGESDVKRIEPARMDYSDSEDNDYREARRAHVRRSESRR